MTLRGTPTHPSSVTIEEHESGHNALQNIPSKTRRPDLILTRP